MNKRFKLGDEVVNYRGDQGKVVDYAPGCNKPLTIRFGRRGGGYFYLREHWHKDLTPFILPPMEEFL